MQFYYFVNQKGDGQMKRFSLLLLVFGFVLSSVSVARAEDYNVAEGKDVTLSGTFFLNIALGRCLFPRINRNGLIR